MTQSDIARPAPSLRWWFVWLIAFYSTWISLVVYGQNFHLLVENAGIALAMMLGSYVAGSTPMGGGTIGFPVLVLLFDQATSLGRDFSFAVQSIGMTSASVFILCRRQELEWPVLGYALVGSAVGTPLGILFIAPHVAPVLTKIVFAVIWASFGVLHLYRLREFVQYSGASTRFRRYERNVGLLSGFAAGLTVAAVTGVGIDMVIYAVLVLLFKADLKLAIPSSVVIMAFTSLVGIATRNLSGGVEPGTYANWLAAAPVVALGAPLGAFIVAKIGRVPTLLFVSILCLIQFVWTLQTEWHTLQWGGVWICVAAVMSCNLAFEWLHRRGVARASGAAIATAPIVQDFSPLSSNTEVPRL